MNERNRAEEHLRVIRSLMERATIYRAISAPTALIGGLLAVAATTVIWWLDRARTPTPEGLDSRLFAEIWLGILAIVLAVNTFFVRQEALRDGRVLLSSGARLALRAIAPYLVLPAAITVWYFKNADPIDQQILVAVWIAFYGLCLLATALFAPRSLAVLGWAFLLSGLLFMFWPKSFADDPRGLCPNFAMGVTFGLYHLVYAVCVWSSRPPVARETLAPE
ncbi:MAG: hypothetical protein ACR2II_11140 [Chthoniobacterales bacterium]